MPHHLFGYASPLQDYSAARYILDASKCIDDIIRRGKVSVLVGGTGLYIDSLLSGRKFSARGNLELRQALEAQYDASGGEQMLQRLGKFDPESAERLHFNDKKRIVRAIEVFETTGKTISQHDLETKALAPRYKAAKVALTFSDRAALYKRIDNRVDIMMRGGLEREVRSLLEMCVKKDSTAMQAIGYKELADAITGGLSMDDAVCKIKMESRRYAKRQLSWLRRDSEIKWVTWENTPEIDLCVRRIIEDYEAK